MKRRHQHSGWHGGPWVLMAAWWCIGCQDASGVGGVRHERRSASPERSALASGPPAKAAQQDHVGAEDIAKADQSVAQLEAAARSADHRVAVPAARALLLRRPDRREAVLRVMLGADPDGTVVHAACEAARKERGRSVEQPWRDALVTVAGRARHVEAKCGALRCLAHASDDSALSQARAGLGGADRLQRCAVEYLRRVGDEGDMEDLRRLAMTEVESPIAVAATEALGHLEAPGVLETLREIGLRHAEEQRGENARRAWVRRRELRPGLAGRVLPQPVERVVAALARLDLHGLAAEVHPEHGLRLGYHGQLAEDHAFSAAEVRGFRLDGRVFDFGTIIGGEESYEGTAWQFLTELDGGCFRDPDRVGYDTWLLRGNGSVSGTVAWAFPDGLFAQLVLDEGCDRERPSMWTSLVVVFRPYQDEWKLAGIVHEAWTI